MYCCIKELKHRDVFVLLITYKNAVEGIQEHTHAKNRVLCMYTEPEYVLFGSFAFMISIGNFTI